MTFPRLASPAVPLLANPVSVRRTPALTFWRALFALVLVSTGIIIIGGTLHRTLTHGREIAAVGVIALVLLSLISAQIDRLKARTVSEDHEKARLTIKQRVADEDANTPLMLTDEQLLWCHKNPVVGARLIALQRSRPHGVLLKRDMRELIALRLNTLTGARRSATTHPSGIIA